MKLKYIGCSVFLFSICFILFDIKIDKIEQIQTHLYFWGAFSKGEIIENKKELKKITDNLFIPSQFLEYVFIKKICLPKLKFEKKEPLVKAKLPSSKKNLLFTLKLPSNESFTCSFPSELEFSLLISNFGIVKMIKKFNYTLCPHIDRIAESFLRKQIFEKKKEDYWRQVKLKLK